MRSGTAFSFQRKVWHEMKRHSSNNDDCSYKSDLLLIATIGLLSHGLIILTDYKVWDTWHSFFFMSSQSQWSNLVRFLTDAGRPVDPLFYYPFRFVPAPAQWVKVFSVFIWIGSAVLLRLLLPVLTSCRNRTALYAAVIAASLPFFEFLGEVCVFMNVCSIFLFLSAWSLLTRVKMMSVRSSWIIRCIVPFLFLVSFNLTSLLPAYCFLLSLWMFLQARNTRITKSLAATYATVGLRNLDLILLPALYWWIKSKWMQTHGYYAETSYNCISLLPSTYLTGFSVSLSAISDRFASGLSAWISSYCLLLLLIFSIVAFLLRGPATRRSLEADPVFLGKLLFGGLILCLLCILPYVAVGKPLAFSGYESRHGVLVNYPLSIVLVALVLLLSAACFRSSDRAIVFAISAIVATGVVECNRNTLRLQGMYAKHLLAIKKISALRDSRNLSVVVFRDYFFLPRTIPWYPVIAWTYMLADGSPPSFLVADTRNFIPDSRTQGADGSAHIQVPITVFSKDDVEALCKITSVPEALKQIPRTGLTINVAFQANAGFDNAETMGLTYLTNMLFKPGRQAHYLDSLGKAYEINSSGAREIKTAP